MKSAEVRMMHAGGHELRVATWRLDMPSTHLPVLFFNGIGANIEALAPLAEALDDRAMVIFDMPGVGGSPEPIMPYNPFTMSWTAERLLDQLALQQVDVIGLSWGGAMAQQFALQHGGRVHRLILCATSAGMPMVPGKLSVLGEMAKPRRYMDAAFVQQNFRGLYADSLRGSRDRVAHMARLKPPSARGLAYQLLAMIGWTGVPALPFLKVPTLIMMGDDDAIVPLSNGRFLHALIRDSELEIVEGGGHLFLLSHRDQSTSRIRAFLDREELRAAA